MNRNCPICNNYKNNILYQQNFYNTEISPIEKYDVVVCNNCGFTYADNIPSQKEFDIYYSNFSKYENNYDEVETKKGYNDYFNNVYNFISPHIKSNKAKILDIGCSTGELLNIFKEKGYKNLIGIDPSKKCCKIVTEKYKIKTYTKTIDTFIYYKKFDVIILSAVLEHIVNLNNFIKKMSTLLTFEGIIFIAVPNVEKFYVYISSPFQQFSIEHINYFSKYSMSNLLFKHKYEIVKIINDVHSFSNITDPDIFVLSKKTCKNNNIQKDTCSKSYLMNYINQCKEMNKIQNEKLLLLFNSYSKLIVWGTGTYTQRLLNTIDISKITYFVDSNEKYHGKKLNGIEIKLPQDIKEDYPIFISTYAYQKDITNQIRNILKLKNKIEVL